MDIWNRVRMWGAHLGIVLQNFPTYEVKKKKKKKKEEKERDS